MSFGSLKFLLCAALFFLSGERLLRAAIPPEDIYEKVSGSVLTLQVENSLGERYVGSAFLALKPGMAVTAWHLVSDAQRVEAWSPDHKPVKVLGLVARDVSRDLAIIQVETNSHPQLPLAVSKPRIGSRAFIIGAPRGLDFSMADGMVSQVREVDGIGQYQLSCPVSPGNSGGPVFNDNGEVIGIVSWRKADAQNLAFAIPSVELPHLDISHAPQPWNGTPAIVKKSPAPSPSTAQPVKAGKDGLAEFERALKQSAGRRVSVTLDDGDQTRQFNFEAPAKLLQP